MPQDLDIKFPVRGLNKAIAFTAPPEGTTPDAMNVRVFDVQGERVRGGSRPGISRAYGEMVGAAEDEVQWLGHVDLRDRATFVFQDEFSTYSAGGLAATDEWADSDASVKVDSSGRMYVDTDPGADYQSAGNYIPLASAEIENATVSSFRFRSRMTVDPGATNGYVKYELGDTAASPITFEIRTQTTVESGVPHCTVDCRLSTATETKKAHVAFHEIAIGFDYDVTVTFNGQMVQAFLGDRTGQAIFPDTLTCEA